jgi:hypothetical protein
MTGKVELCLMGMDSAFHYVIRYKYEILGLRVIYYNS